MRQKYPENSIGLVRLTIVSIYVLSITPGIYFGGLHQLSTTAQYFGSVAGDITVALLFVLSGYLISEGFFRSTSTKYFFVRRIIRIYPAFVFAYFFSAIVVGQLMGRTGPVVAPLNALLLQPPPAIFVAPVQSLTSFIARPAHINPNFSLWAVAYLMRCYILIGLLAAFGLARRKSVVVGITLVLLTLYVGVYVILTFDRDTIVLWLSGWPDWADMIFGNPLSTIRLTAPFFVGVCLNVYGDMLVGRTARWLAAAAAVIGVVGLCSEVFYEFFTVTFSAFALVWFCLNFKPTALRPINAQWDISYGIYLYGCPLAFTIQTLAPGLSFWPDLAATLAGAWIFGALSWVVIERPIVRLGRRRSLDDVEAMKVVQA